MGRQLGTAAALQSIAAASSLWIQPGGGRMASLQKGLRVPTGLSTGLPTGLPARTTLHKAGASSLRAVRKGVTGSRKKSTGEQSPPRRLPRPIPSAVTADAVSEDPPGKRHRSLRGGAIIHGDIGLKTDPDDVIPDGRADEAGADEANLQEADPQEGEQAETQQQQRDATVAASGDEGAGQEEEILLVDPKCRQ